MRRAPLAAMVLLVAAMVEDEDTTPTKIKVSDLKEKEIELGQREEALAAPERSVVARGEEFARARQALERDSDCPNVIRDLQAVEERNRALEEKLQTLQKENFALIHEKHTRDEMERRERLKDGYSPKREHKWDTSGTHLGGDTWDTYPSGTYTNNMQKEL